MHFTAGTSEAMLSFPPSGRGTSDRACSHRAGAVRAHRGSRAMQAPKRGKDRRNAPGVQLLTLQAGSEIDERHPLMI